MYKIETTNRFKQNLRKAKRGGIDVKIIEEAINILARGDTLPKRFRNHPLNGKYDGYYDCHILPDLVLIYKIEKKKLILILFDIGSHSNLF